MIDRREHPLGTAELAGGTTARPTDLREPMDTETPRDAQDRAPEGEPRDTGMAAGTRPLAEPSMATPGATKSTASAPSAPNQEENAQAGASPLVPAGEATSFRARWGEGQTCFGDEPRHAVEQADARVAEMMRRLARVFADECTRLEQQWCQGDDVSTEDRRVRLRRYRYFFDRLLSA